MFNSSLTGLGGEVTKTSPDSPDQESESEEDELIKQFKGLTKN